MLFCKCHQMAVYVIKNSKYYPRFFGFSLILAFLPLLGKYVSASATGLLRKVASAPAEPQAQVRPPLTDCLPDTG